MQRDLASQADTSLESQRRADAAVTGSFEDFLRDKFAQQ
jgi:hypothetical protein